MNLIYPEIRPEQPIPEITASSSGFRPTLAAHVELQLALRSLQQPGHQFGFYTVTKVPTSVALNTTPFLHSL